MKNANSKRASLLTILSVLRKQEQEVGGAHVAAGIDVFGAHQQSEQFGGLLFVRGDG